MAWTVEWSVTGGHSGARPDRSPTRIYQGDHVRFVLRLADDYQYALEMAETNRGWRDLPRLIVRGYRNTQTTTHAGADDPLIIDYTFNYEGAKQLRFTGVAAEFVDPTQRVPRRDASGALRREAMFPNLDLVRELRVAPSTSRGEATASTAGAGSDTARRQQSQMEQRRELADRLRRRQEQERQEALGALEDDARVLREAALPRRSGLSSRGVLLGIDLREAHEISTGTIEQAQAYLARLQSAISVTPALQLYNHPWVDVPGQGAVSRTRFQQQRIAWQVDGGHRLIKVRQFRYKFGAGTSGGIDQRPPLRTNIPMETIRLQANDWLVVQFSHGGAKSLIPVQAAIASIHSEQLSELADALVTLGSLALSVSASPGALAFELLASVLMPPQVSAVLGIASISVSAVRGLARLLARVVRSGGTLRAANTALLRGLAGLTRPRGGTPPRPNPRGTGHVIDNAQRGLSPRTGRTLPGVGPVRRNPRTGDTLPGIGPNRPRQRTGDTLPGIGPNPPRQRTGDTLPGTGPTPPGPRTGDTLPGAGPDPRSLPYSRTLPGARSGRTRPGIGPGVDDIGRARTLPDVRSTGVGASGGRPGEPIPAPDGRIMQHGNGGSVLREMTDEEVRSARAWRIQYRQDHGYGEGYREPRFGGPTEGAVYQEYWRDYGGAGNAPRHGFVVINGDDIKVIFNNSLRPGGTPELHAPFPDPATW